MNGVGGRLADLFLLPPQRGQRGIAEAARQRDCPSTCQVSFLTLIRLLHRNFSLKKLSVPTEGTQPANYTGPREGFWHSTFVLYSLC